MTVAFSIAIKYNVTVRLKQSENIGKYFVHHVSQLFGHNAATRPTVIMLTLQ
jgi:hypothetical protein